MIVGSLFVELLLELAEEVRFGTQGYLIHDGRNEEGCPHSNSNEIRVAAESDEGKSRRKEDEVAAGHEAVERVLAYGQSEVVLHPFCLLLVGVADFRGNLEDESHEERDGYQNEGDVVVFDELLAELYSYEFLV